jgi:hypothetical protein
LVFTLHGIGPGKRNVDTEKHGFVGPNPSGGEQTKSNEKDNYPKKFVNLNHGTPPCARKTGYTSIRFFHLRKYVYCCQAHLLYKKKIKFSIINREKMTQSHFIPYIWGWIFSPTVILFRITKETVKLAETGL